MAGKHVMAVCICYSDSMIESSDRQTMTGEGEDAMRLTIDMAERDGRYIRGALGSEMQLRWKPDNTPVTTIDTAVNTMLIQEIIKKFPHDRIYGEEESYSNASDYNHTWIIDPVDGTQALGKLDTCTVCIARVDRRGNPVLGVVHNPLRDETYMARFGERSYCNGSPLAVSHRRTVKRSYIHFGSALRFEELATNGIAYDRLESQEAKIFNTRSLAYGAVAVARGEFDGAYIGVKTPFEAASVALIVEGAGGLVTDIYGNTPGRLDGEIRGMIVSNGHIHGALVEALRQ